MSQYKGVIFDLDGTLLDTIADLSDSVNEVLRQFGHPEHTYGEYKLLIGKGFRNLLENSFPAGSWEEKTIDEALAVFLETYDKKYMDKTAPYEGIDQMLDELNEMGIKIAVNSNKRTDYTNALIQKFFGRIPFVGVFGERAGIPKKPDPASALELAEKMGLEPGQILYVGDSKTDMVTAANAGMTSVGVEWGFRGYKELKENGAGYIVKRAEEITELFR